MAAEGRLLLLLLVSWRRGALGEDHPPEALAHPGGPRCYYDAMANGCPTSISSDGYKFLCTCDYRDNTWFHVLGNFLTIFREDAGKRSTLAEQLKARTEPNGVLSLDVGLPERLQCAGHLATVYPGTATATATTGMLLDIQELYSMLGSILWPQVRAALMNICVPVRIALQLICQHALLHGLKDYDGAREYARKAWSLWEMVDKCVDDQSPFPFPGLGDFLKPWQSRVPEVTKMAWYPDPGLMRAKLPEESSQHYWPCVPLKDPLCFPAGSDLTYTSCSECCDPGLGPTGNADCFIGEWSFTRCCNTPNDQGRFW